MALHKLTKGLDLPISGTPVQTLCEENRRTCTRVAVMADDFVGMKPRMHVEVGNRVKRGELLFENRKVDGIRHTSPGAGKIVAIHRGARRALQSVVIELSEAERNDTPSEAELQPFASYSGKAPTQLHADAIRALLIESGAWVAFRTRPFSKVPHPQAKPHAIFVTAIDTNPLTVLPEVVIEKRRGDFQTGLHLIATLTEGKTFLCIHPDSGIDKDLEAPVTVEQFCGPHPAGNAGTHIHFLDPVRRDKSVWTIGYQDVLNIGSLFQTGKLDVHRVIALGGPTVANPRLLRTRIGACVECLTRNEDFGNVEVRLIAGSILSGKKAMGDVFGYLGHYDRQLSVVPEGREREFLGWIKPGLGAFSSIPVYLSAILPARLAKRFQTPTKTFTTNLHGSPRALVPIGMYERVMPLDILPTFLFRAMLVGDTEQAEKLGCLELDEEDVALCTFVCPSKIDYGPVLRRNLELIEEED